MTLVEARPIVTEPAKASPLISPVIVERVVRKAEISSVKYIEDMGEQLTTTNRDFLDCVQGVAMTTFSTAPRSYLFGAFFTYDTVNRHLQQQTRTGVPPIIPETLRDHLFQRFTERRLQPFPRRVDLREYIESEVENLRNSQKALHDALNKFAAVNPDAGDAILAGGVDIYPYLDKYYIH